MNAKMKIYWSLRGIPELSGLSAPERRRLHQTCRHQHLLGAPLTRASAFALLSFLVVDVLFWSLGEWLVGLIGVRSSWGGGLLASGIGAAAAFFTFDQLTISYLRPFYHQHRDAEKERLQVQASAAADARNAGPAGSSEGSGGS